MLAGDRYLPRHYPVPAVTSTVSRFSMHVLLVAPSVILCEGNQTLDRFIDSGDNLLLDMFCQ